MMKNTKRNLALVAIFLGASAFGGPSYKLNLKPYELQATDYPFPSGLRVLIQEDHSQPSVMVQSVFDHGSTSDPVGKEGEAHVIEHLMFRAQHPGHPKNMDWIKELGAEFNADTQDDITEYYTIAPKDALADVLKIEAMRMTNPLENVDDAVLKVEREVVRNELRMRMENTLGNKPFEDINALLFPEGSTYHRSGIGSHETLDAITFADCKKFTDQYYTPANATIVIVGDIDRKEVGRMVQTIFPHQLFVAPGSTDPKYQLVQNPKPRISGASAEPPPPADKNTKRIKGPISNPTVILGWSLPGAYRGHDALMEITTASMSSAVASLLYPTDPTDPETRKVEGLGCFFNPGREFSTAYCFIELKQGEDPDKIAAKAIDGLSEMWSSDSESQQQDLGDGTTIKIAGQRELFKMARTEIQADLFRSSASLGRASDISHFVHFTGRTDYFSNRLEELSKVTSFDAREFAHKYFTRDRVVRLVVEPYSLADQPPAPVIRDTGAAWAGAILDKPADVEDFAHMPASKIASIARAPAASDFKELTLDNGLRVILKKHGDAPFVKAALLANGGPASVTPYGFIDYDRHDMSTKDPGQIAASWDSARGPDWTSQEVIAPSGNLPAALDLLYDRVSTTHSVWTKREMDLELSIAKERVATEEKRPEIWGRREYTKRLFRNHPFGTVVPPWDEIAKVSAGDFKSYLDKTWAPKNTTLIVVGDLDFADAEKQVRSIWSNWRKKDPGSLQPVVPVQPEPPARSMALIDSADATQADVTVGCELKLGGKLPAYNVLSGLLTETLWTAIRERSGASYGVYAAAVGHRDKVEYLVASGLIQNDKAVNGLKTILDGIADLRAGKIDPAAMMRTKWNIARTSYVAYQSNDDMLASIENVTMRGLPLSAYQDYPQDLANVSVKDLQDLLEPCAGHEVVSVVGPQKTLKTALDTLKIPVEVVDWQKTEGKPNADSKASAK